MACLLVSGAVCSSSASSGRKVEATAKDKAFLIIINYDDDMLC